MQQWAKCKLQIYLQKSINTVYRLLRSIVLLEIILTNVDVDITITPHLIEIYTKRLKIMELNQIILLVVLKHYFLYLSLLFKTMLIHGYNPSDLLL